MNELSDFDATLLNFEEKAPRSLGLKEDLIRKELGISPIRYYQRLNVLIDVPEAVEKHPVLLSRLRRQRDRRADERDRAKEAGSTG